MAEDQQKQTPAAEEEVSQTVAEVEQPEAAAPAEAAPEAAQEPAAEAAQEQAHRCRDKAHRTVLYTSRRHPTRALFAILFAEHSGTRRVKCGPCSRVPTASPCPSWLRCC